MAFSNTVFRFVLAVFAIVSSPLFASARDWECHTVTTANSVDLDYSDLTKEDITYLSIVMVRAFNAAYASNDDIDMRWDHFVEDPEILATRGRKLQKGIPGGGYAGGGCNMCDNDDDEVFQEYVPAPDMADAMETAAEHKQWETNFCNMAQGVEKFKDITGCTIELHDCQYSSYQSAVDNELSFENMVVKAKKAGIV